MIRIVMSAFLFFIYIPFSQSQSQKTEWDGNIRIQDGVKIISNNGKPIYSKRIFEIEKEKVFGAEREIPGFDVDVKGYVYIVDRSTAEIKVFNPQGKKISTFGKKGQGPGEFQMPVFIRAGSESLTVFDFLSRRMIHLSLEGTYIDQKISLRTFAPIGVDSYGYWLGTTSLAPQPIGGIELIKYDPDLKPVLEIYREEPDYSQKEKRELTIGKPSIKCAFSGQSEIYWGMPNKYEIKVIDKDGKTVKMIRNKSDRLPISAAEKKSYEDQYKDFPGKLIFSDSWPAYKGLSLDERGRLFVETYKKEKSTAASFYDIFDAEGRLIAQQAISAGINNRSVWKSGYLYTIESDEEGYQSVFRYLVKWAM